ncbi:MAG TPA: right-handed parallel beta-helix repeat-containing protein [Thermohalobaculum sp.]|nr:right-handed parallel beta-helix repeat-containing protein [Thermohalobaculum sp.]
MFQFQNRFGVAALFAVASVGLSILAAHAGSNQSVVCESGNDLQKQIDSASDGATLFFGEKCDGGPYFVSGKDINLRGFSSGAVMSAPGDNNCVLSIEFARVEISRVDIDASGAAHGICIGIGSSVRIFGNTVVRDAGSIGIALGHGASALIEDNTLVEGASEAGIDLLSGAHALIWGGSQIRNNGAGIVISGAASAAVEDVELTGNSGAGVRVDLNSALELAGETLIEENDAGVVCGESGALLVLGSPGDIDFGSGNPGGGDHTNDVLGSPTCHVSNLTGGPFPFP